MSSEINKEPFRFISSHGATFTSTKCDFGEGVVVACAPQLTPAAFLEDVIEMMLYHKEHVWGHLNGFRGYSSIRYSFDPKVTLKVG